MNQIDKDFHFSRTIPMTILLALLGNLVYGIWSTAIFKTEVEARIEYLEIWREEMRGDQFTVYRGIALEKRIKDNEDEILSLDEKMDLVLSKLTRIEFQLEDTQKISYLQN